MATGRKKTKKQRDKTARASLNEITPGVLANKNMQKELKRLGIDPEELDFVGDNVMQHPKSGKLKMIDV